MPSASASADGLFDSRETVPSSLARRSAATLPSIRVMASARADAHSIRVSRRLSVASANASRYSSEVGHAPASARRSRPAAHQLFASRYWLWPVSRASSGSRNLKS